MRRYVFSHCHWSCYWFCSWISMIECLFSFINNICCVCRAILITELIFLVILIHSLRSMSSNERNCSWMLISWILILHFLERLFFRFFVFHELSWRTVRISISTVHMRYGPISSHYFCFFNLPSCCMIGFCHDT